MKTGSPREADSSRERRRERWFYVCPLTEHSWFDWNYGEEPAISGCSNHIFQNKMTVSNNHLLTLTKSTDTHSLLSGSMWQWLSHTVCPASVFTIDCGLHTHSSIFLCRASERINRIWSQGCVSFIWSSFPFTV